MHGKGWNATEFVSKRVKKNNVRVRTYDAEKHHLIPWSMVPMKSKAEIKQLPDWLRRALALPERFRKGHSLHVPHEMEATLNDFLERMLAGPNRDLQSSSNIKIPTIVKTALTILDNWREAAKKVSEDWKGKAVFSCF